MSEFLSRVRRKFSEEPYFRLGLTVGILTGAVGLAMYAYLGTFSRYGSDDYCLSAFFHQGDLLGRMISRYFVSSGRYTNILFIGLVDRVFGWYNVAILPPLMLSLFVGGLYLVVQQLGALMRRSWSDSVAVFMAVTITYFSILQAPDLYETLYWRAGMTSHFAPLVLILFLGAFWLRQARLAHEQPPSIWIQALSFIGPFLVGGLSEPPTAMMITVLTLGLVAAWWWGEGRARRHILTVLLWSLLGAVLALLVMAVAPANSLRLQTPPPGFFELVSRTVRYPFDFVLDTVRTLPTPTLISVALPAMLFLVKYANPSRKQTDVMTNRPGIVAVAVLLIAYLLIASTFAPSIYGQSYPVPRARFAGRVLMTAALMIDGALLGILAAGLGSKYFRSPHLHRVSALLLLLLVFYPLRSAGRVLGEIPAYRQRAAAWDLRDARIRSLQAEGEQDLVVRFLQEEQIQDLGDHTRFRLNRCASIIYGVSSIVAVPMEED